MLVSTICQLDTQPFDRRDSFETLPRPNWPLGIFVGYFLDYRRIQSRYHPLILVLDFMGKLSEQQTMSDPMRK